MKITCKEVVTRFITVDVPDELVETDECWGEDLETPEIRDIIYTQVDQKGWDTEYCHESSFERGEHEPRVFLQGP